MVQWWGGNRRGISGRKSSFASSFYGCCLLLREREVLWVPSGHCPLRGRGDGTQAWYCDIARYWDLFTVCGFNHSLYGESNMNLKCQSNCNCKDSNSKNVGEGMGCVCKEYWGINLTRPASQTGRTPTPLSHQYSSPFPIARVSNGRDGVLIWAAVPRHRNTGNWQRQGEFAKTIVRHPPHRHPQHCV